MKTLLVGDVCPTVHSTPYYKEKNIPALFGDTQELISSNGSSRKLLLKIQQRTIVLCACGEYAGSINEQGITIGLIGLHLAFRHYI